MENRRSFQAGGKGWASADEASALVILCRQLEDHGCNQNNGKASGKRNIGENAGLLDAEILADEAEIIHGTFRKFAAVPDEVTIGKDRQDEGCEDEANPEGVGIAPDLGAGAEEQSVDEGEHGVETDQPGRRLPGTLDIAAVHAMDPAGIEV